MANRTDIKQNLMQKKDPQQIEGPFTVSLIFI